MDVISAVDLENQIKLFVEQNNIPPSNILIIVSPNVVFEKDIEGMPSDTREAQVQRFLDTVPFENLYTLTFPTAQGIHVIAVNKGLCETLKNSFIKIGSTVDSIIPYSALGPDGTNLTALSADVGRQLIKKVDSVRHSGFPLEKPTQSTTSPSPKDTSVAPKKRNIRLYVMIGFLAVITVFLLFLIVNGG
jgi:hypothetical protein